MTDNRLDLYTDRQHLTTAAYGSGAKLAARQDLYRWQQPRIDLAGWVLDQIDWSGTERVLDLGCGNGAYLRRLVERIGPRGAVLGLDLSHGMLDELSRNWDAALRRPHLAQADAQALPLPDGSCDVALAMHMLYHVPDIAQAVRELRRVLRPGGVLLAATNSLGDKKELNAAFDAAVATVAGDGRRHTAARWSERFSLEGGAGLLQDAFAHVERRDVVGTLVLDDVAPLLRYMASTRQTTEPELPAGVRWESVMAELERIVNAAIAAHGAFRVETRAGVFVCR